MDASNGYLKRDYSAEKIGGTKGRPYKPVTSYIFDMKVANYKNEGYTDLEAYEKAMRKIGKDYGLEWRKL